jgi:hypothetical protein
MTAVDTSAPYTSTKTALSVIGMGVAVAVIVNVLVYSIGRLAGGDFAFTQDGRTVQVDAVTVAGFSAGPLGLGLLAVLLLRANRWTGRVALWVAPLLAVATILVMTIPVPLDRTSTVALAACHLTLVPISIVTIRRLTS